MVENHPPVKSKHERSTAAILGHEYNISSDTVKKNEKFAKGLDVLPESVKQDILSGKSKESKEDLKSLVNLPQMMHGKEIIKKIESGNISIHFTLKENPLPLPASLLRSLGRSIGMFLGPSITLLTQRKIALSSKCSLNQAKTMSPIEYLMN